VLVKRPGPTVEHCLGSDPLDRVALAGARPLMKKTFSLLSLLLLLAAPASAAAARSQPARRCPTVKGAGAIQGMCATLEVTSRSQAKNTMVLPTSPVSVTQTSADLSQALAEEPGLRFAPAAAPPEGIPVVNVNDGARHQTFTGVGAAMTDSSAWLMWDALPPPARTQLFHALFSPSAADLGFLRVPMGASDFSATGQPYSYDDRPAGQDDPSLAGFSVAHDDAYIVPALRAARALNSHLYLEAVPWSPPAWMKANDALDNVQHAGTLLPQYMPALAQYFVKFLQAYADRGLAVNAIAPQNEPGVPTSYPGVELNQAQETSFVANDLRPALAAANLSPAVFGWDLAWGPLKAGIDPVVDQAASGGLTGLAWHCYFGSPNYMSAVHRATPSSMQIVDECATGSGDVFPTSELLISALRTWASAVALWNLALTPSGGPVQPPNWGCPGCTGVATVDEQTGSYTLSRDYYELAQLSHFVRPGAVRISTPSFVSYRLGLLDNYQTVISPGLDDVAFLNPNGSKVLFLYNNATTPITFAVRWRGSQITYTIPAGATTTLTWR
jgi:glucosylceramidase